MKLKRTIACVLSAVLMLPAFVQAADEKLAEINDSGVITIKGTTEELAGTKVTFMIMRPGYDDKSLESEESANLAVEEMYQSKVGIDGSFSYSYTLNPKSKSGNYTVSVKINGEENKRTDTVYFKNTQNLKDAVEAINKGTMTVTEAIETYKDDIDYETGIKYDTATPGQKSYITGAIKNPTETGETSLTAQFKEYTDIAFTLISNESITATEIKNAVENKNVKLGLTSDEYKTYTDLTLSEKEVAIAYMKDNYKDIDTMSDFITLFKNAVTEADEGNGEGGFPSQGGNGGGNKGGNGGVIAAPGAGDMYVLDPSQAEVFSDLEQASWAKDAILKLAELGVVNGKGDRTFAPNANITREEFVSIIVRAFQLAKADKDLAFEDVNADAWYYNSVKVGYSCGLITGYDDKKFGIGDLITRQDMAVIIKRAVDFSNMELYPIYLDKVLNDSDTISEYAKESVNTMVKAGVINGYEDGSFRPFDKATRAQAVQMIYNILFK